MIYLASPYTHPDERTQIDRSLHAAMYTGWSMEQGNTIYSPVIHGAALANSGAVGPITAADHAFWMRHCLGMLAAARCLYILPLDGWRESRGVWMEIQHARSLGICTHIVQTVPSYLSQAIELLDVEEIEAMGWEVVR